MCRATAVSIDELVGIGSHIRPGKDAYVEGQIRKLQDTEPHSCKEGSETTPELPPNYPRTTRDKILEIIQKNPRISRKEIADQLGLSIDGVRYHIRKLTEDKILEYIGKSRNGYLKISLDSIKKNIIQNSMC